MDKVEYKKEMPRVCPLISGRQAVTVATCKKCCFFSHMLGRNLLESYEDNCERGCCPSTHKVWKSGYPQCLFVARD